MIQRSRWLLVCLLLLITTVGCDKTTTPKPTTSPQAASPASPASPVVSWKTINGNGVQLSLPPSYEGGNPSTDLDAIAKSLTAIDPKYAQGIASLKANPSAVALLAFDKQSAKSGFMTNVNVTTEKVPDGTTVQQYLDAAANQLVGSYQLVDKKVVSIGKYQAGRIVAEGSAGGTPIKQLFYLIQNGNNFWLVTYSTAKSEFDKRLPDFEKSISTFMLPS